MFAIKLLKAKTDFLTVKLRLLFIKNKQLRNRYKKFNLYKISKTSETIKVHDYFKLGEIFEE